MDEFLRVLVTKNIAEGESGENHPEHGPSSVKEVRHDPPLVRFSRLRLHRPIAQDLPWY